MHDILFRRTGSQGHGRRWPGFSGAPTECRQGTKEPVSPDFGSGDLPIRVMIRMSQRHRAESEIWTPILQMGESSGPMAKGMTYIVRPCIHPLKIAVSFCLISMGSAQLLVGPASSLVLEQIKCDLRRGRRRSDANARENEPGRCFR